MSQDTDLPRVAVIGLAGRFPGANDIDDFWRGVVTGRDCLTRFDHESAAEPGQVPVKGVLEGADLFDAGLFGFSPREAEVLDPQQRIFLECSFAALDDAGIVPASFDGRVGVFGGSSLNTYLMNNVLPDTTAMSSLGPYQVMQASDKDFLCTRVAYKLGLTGPAMTVQTACSTSLTAVHLACQSLLAGECDAALAGGVSIGAPLEQGYPYQEGGIASPDGTCRPFDAEANGTVPGNGVGVVVLRRLEDAIEDGDTILAVIRGTAVNNDGGHKAGYTAPSVDGQASVIREALAVAGVGPEEIDYLEAHGTATDLGDMIEVAALRQVFGETSATPRVLGAVKGNVGHLDAAAGICGFIKTVLSLVNECHAPTAHFTSPNPRLALDTSGFEVLSEARPWPRGSRPRIAGVSSFGIGGTNVHVILEEAPQLASASPATSDDEPLLFELSSSSAQAVVETGHRLATHLEEQRPALAEVTAALSRRRDLDWRAAVVATGHDEAVRRLRDLDPGQVVRSRPRRRVIFMFPGQGAQYPGMAAGLYAADETFARAFDECAAAFKEQAGLDLADLVLGERTPQADERLARTEFTQPALFTVEYALARAWMSVGVEPAAMVGHSIGEYVAACLAGVMDLPDAVRLVAARGRLVQTMPTGGMLGVTLPASDVTKLLAEEAPDCVVAAVNAPELVAVSGPVDSITRLEKHLDSAGVGNRRLHTSHGFHSPAMEGAVEPLSAVVATATLRAPNIPFYSNTSGSLITPEQAQDPGYWGRHVREPVLFADAIAELLTDDRTVLLEVGPGRTLGDLVRLRPDRAPDHVVVSSLRHPNDRVSDRETMLAAAGTLWAAGVEFDHHRLAPTSARRARQVPARALTRERYWIHPETRAVGTASADASATGPVVVPTWRRAAAKPVGEGRPEQRWVVLDDSTGLGDALARALDASGRAVRRIGPSELDGPALTRHISEALADGGTELVAVVVPGEAADEADGRRRTAQRLIDLSQAVEGLDPETPLTVATLTRGVFDVLGDERTVVTDAIGQGLVAGLAHERPRSRQLVVDIPGDDPWIPAVVAALTAHSGVVAVRGRHCWIREYAPAVTSPGHSLLRDGGTYLITGGLGGVGLALAQHIASRVTRPTLVLVGRRGEVAGELAEQLKSVAELAEVVTLACDVSDPAAVARLVDDLADRGHRLDGVIHAAGVSGGAMVARSTVDSVDDVVRPKLDGARAVASAFADHQLDFLMLCSSLTVTTGGFGQGDYAAANAALDALATQGLAGHPVVSVQWGRWEGVGMASAMPVGAPGRSDSSGSDHPLIGSRNVVSESEEVLTTTLRTDKDWVVDDHRLMGHGLVPGTAYLEIVRAALADRAGGGTVELHDIMFVQPVVVPDGAERTIHTTVREVGEGNVEFTIRSRDTSGGVWQAHATGWARIADAVEDTYRDLAEVRAQCRVRETLGSRQEILERARAERWTDGPLRFQVGPRWEVLDTLELGEGHVLARLALNERFWDDVDTHHLHPALLDMAVGVFRIDADDPNYLPLSYGAVRQHHPLTPVIWCHAWAAERNRDSVETLSCDMEILDAEGKVLVEITDYSVKRVHDVDSLMEQITGSVEAARALVDRPAEPDVLDELSRGLDLATARAAFDTVLACRDLPRHVLVTPRPVAAMVALAERATEVLFGVSDQSEQAGSRHPRPALDTPLVEPRTPIEADIAAIWEETLGIDQVGVLDDFFALGGHSIAAVQIGTRVRSRLGVSFDLKDFYGTPTVAHLAELIAGAGDAAPEAVPLVRVADEIDDMVTDMTPEEIDRQLRAMLAEGH
ncbi:type I polyketide synthase [Micromonospora sp. CP22]|uniref:type I polyketide synthase n=1 Tax=Micromonospora sp. CP22 TaxID=2580517 RepID=UPI0012BBECD5|nr:type I polyketide synthase [Micromonospora sp. CP22]MTK01204.1 SDR family NAD(P)-dependent oxidoreductase [Micromonospora sp. CP22]